MIPAIGALTYLFLSVWIVVTAHDPGHRIFLDYGNIALRLMRFLVIN